MVGFAGFRASLLAGAALVLLTPQAFAASFNFTSGTNPAQTLKANETGTVGAAASITTAGVGVTWDPTANNTTAAVLNNSGTISGTTRGIDNNGTATVAQSFTYNGAAGSTLTSVADAFRINKDILGGTVSINNSGTIQSTGAQQALDFAAITSAATVNITNKLGGIIQSSGQSAIELGGSNFTIANDGTIQSANAATQRGINFKPANLTSLTSYSLTNGSLGNSTALISSADDAVRISATGLTGANLTTVYNVSVDNYGTIKTNNAGSGQAIDFNDLVSKNGTVTITNRAGGVLQAADADGIRAGTNATINNSGTIRSDFLTGASGNASGNDAIDFQSNTGGVVNNFAGGDITGAKNGITGKYAPTIFNAGTITGRDGSGINIDTSLEAVPVNGPVSNTGITTVINSGTITGTAVSGDGDAIDVDYLVNITNSGTIKAVGIGVAPPGSPDPAPLNEALAIGGGTVTNNAGGLIISDQRAITVDDSNLGNAYGAVTIDNAGTITGSNGQAINIHSISDNSLTNRATGIINGSVVMGAGTDTINLYAGSVLNGALDGGNGSDTIHLLGSGSGTLANVSNVEILKVDAGSWALTGTQTYSSGVTVAAGATMLVNNGVLGGSDLTNNGTVRVNNSTVNFTGNLQNNGAYISDPSTQTFNNVSVGANGYIQAGAGDVFKVGGNFANASTQGSLWNTQEATLELIGVDQTNHWIDVLGADNGKTARHQDFSWGELDIDGGNLITFKNGTALGNRGWYVADLIGALISGSAVTNITGFDGLTVYYDAYQTDNAYLGGLTYALQGGGQLVADVPEPMTWIIFLSGLGLLGGVMRRRRAEAVAG